MSADHELTSSQKPKHKGRVVIALCIAALVLTLTILGGWFFVAFVLVMFLLSLRELLRMMAAKGIHPSKRIIYWVGFALIALAAFGHTKYFLPAITTGMIAIFVRHLFCHPRASISDIGATILAIFYTAFFPVHYILLRDFPEIYAGKTISLGLGAVILTFLVIALSDTGAYYVGKNFGKTLLYPAISPKKTWEGSVGGLVFALLTGMPFALWFGLPWFHALTLIVLLVIIGTLGDLFESLLKRDAGVKDSSSLLQGHGGILDRIDSYIFSGSVSYYYIYWIVLKQGLFQDFTQTMRLF